MQTECEIVVSEADLDELGHVNHARYLHFLELGRMDWYAQVGLFERVAALYRTSDINSVVVNITIDFSRECRLGEQLVVKTAPERLGRKSLRLRQVIQKPSGDLAAKAVVTSVIMNLQSRTAVVLPDDLALLFANPAPVEPGQD